MSDLKSAVPPALPRGLTLPGGSLRLKEDGISPGGELNRVLRRGPVTRSCCTGLLGPDRGRVLHAAARRGAPEGLR